MPKTAVRFVFTAEQTQRIQSFFPEFVAHVEQHDPTHEGRNLRVTNWKKDIAQKLLQEPLFEGLDEAESKKSWQTVSVLIITFPD